ncbi:DUF192 domain-containing protein [Iningainema tapete]|uniref:DUF192 domain-containing protein n=1 Tax=Iningainema tapete BLCC-T55 TaxID=2748662 RepID=A0A8J7BWA4_9CYAN|nr:DUF192 domain-containing protein [Iningainema tapete]MBD2771497.1 DUF192 domain-containing protein [Iningainema tapete BLCC-T55]
MTIKIADLWIKFALSAGLIFFGQSTVMAQSNSAQVLPISATAEIAGQTFDLEVALTPEQQAMGLMNRTFLPDNRGLLFPFNPPQPASFWMRDTPIPLDIIFLLNGTVLDIARNLQPCLTELCPSYLPAFEINENTTDIGIDDIFIFQSEPQGISDTIKLPQNIFLAPVDQVIEVRGGRTSELGLQKGESVAVRPVSESSSSIQNRPTNEITEVPESPFSVCTLALGALGVGWLFKRKQNRLSKVKSCI